MYGFIEQTVLTHRVKYALDGNYVVKAALLSAKEKDLVTDLTGTTALVYWYLLKKGNNPVGVREVMRALKFSSPSSATYHLEKLMNLGLINKNNMGAYYVVKRVKTGLFQAFIFVKGWMLPKQLIYALTISVFICIYLLLFLPLLNLITVCALIPAIIGCGLFWYEAIGLFRRRPRLP